MLFRTQVYVALAIRPENPHWPNGDGHWYDTVSYTFGINAEDAAEAADIATRASENAIDRDGKYIGGVVVEVHAKCVGHGDFNGYDRYLLQPIDHTGIFYVSGVCHTSIAMNEVTCVEEQLNTLRRRISADGTPPASFAHPPVKHSETPKTVRIVCPVCEHWVEVDNSGLLYSFFDGLDPLADEYDEGRQAVTTAGPFVSTHFDCLRTSTCVDALIFLTEDDEQYDLVDESKRQ